MAKLSKIIGGKWQVLDTALGIEEYFDSYSQARERALMCDVEKIKKMV